MLLLGPSSSAWLHPWNQKNRRQSGYQQDPIPLAGQWWQNLLNNELKNIFCLSEITYTRTLFPDPTKYLRDYNLINKIWDLPSPCSQRKELEALIHSWNLSPFKSHWPVPGAVLFAEKNWWLWRALEGFIHLTTSFKSCSSKSTVYLQTLSSTIKKACTYCEFAFGY